MSDGHYSCCIDWIIRVAYCLFQYNTKALTFAVTFGILPAMADASSPPGLAPSTPKKVGRPPKVKGARKISQDTAARLRRVQNQNRHSAAKEAKALREASQGLPLVASMSETEQIEDIKNNSVDNGPVLSVQMEQKTLATAMTDGDNCKGRHDGDHQQSRIVQKRKVPMPPAIATPSPIPKKRDILENDVFAVDDKVQDANSFDAQSVDNEAFVSNPDAKTKP
uniref:BZIP domain-containing protein n=1 Tax=Panagrellus redivivus TaxID=6233 RepID=A0A7E4W1X1_PANRE